MDQITLTKLADYLAYGERFNPDKLLVNIEKFINDEQYCYAIALFQMVSVRLQSIVSEDIEVRLIQLLRPHSREDVFSFIFILSYINYLKTLSLYATTIGDAGGAYSGFLENDPELILTYLSKRVIAIDKINRQNDNLYSRELLIDISRLNDQYSKWPLKLNVSWLDDLSEEYRVYLHEGIVKALSSQN